MIKFEDFEVVKNFQDKDKESILNYIRLVYDKQSKLQSIPSLDDRKQKAMEQSGLADKSIPALKNEKVNTLIHAYLGLYQSSNKYYNYQANLQLFWEMQEMLMEPLKKEGEDNDDEARLKRVKLKAELSENTGKLLNRLASQESEIFGAEAEQDMARELIRKEIAIKSPEQRLKKVS